jgi:osmotically-inducible protein OsmY
MNSLRKSFGKWGMLILPAVLLSFAVPAPAADQSDTSQQQQKPATESKLGSEIRHELTMLPYYTIFDDLEYQLKDNGTVVLSGEVVWANLKDDAESAVRHIEGVNKVINNIEILPLSMQYRLSLQYTLLWITVM